MTYLKITLLGMDWQGAVLTWALLLVHLWEGHSSTTATPLMSKGYPLIPLPLGSHLERGVVVGEIKVTGVVVIPMRLLPPEGGGRKRKGSLVRPRSWNLGARRVILMMWLTPLGNGSVALCIIMNTMRIPTSCP